MDSNISEQLTVNQNHGITDRESFQSLNGTVCEFKELNDSTVMGLSVNKRYIAVGGQKEYNILEIK